MARVRLWIAIVAMALGCASAHAQGDLAAKTGATPVAVKIEAQSIRGALQAFGAQTGVQVLFRSEDAGIGEVRTPRVVGKWSAPEALERLLKDTGLKYEFVNEHTVRVWAAKPLSGTRAVESPEQSARLSNVSSDYTPSSEQASAKVEEVVVTARRRAERLQDVPLSVQALQGSALKTLNIRKSEDLNAVAAGLSVDYASNSRNVTFGMRGQTQVSSSPEPAVQVYFDQLPVLFGGIDFYDLGQIEVLHGPQGTLFGRNTTGGALVIHPQAPVLNQFEGYTEAVVGNLNAENVEGAVNIPIISNTLAVRISGLRTRRDGYITNLTTGQKLNDEHTDALRLQMLYKPTDGFEDKVLLGYRGQSTNGTAFLLTQPETLETMFGFPGLEAAFPAANAQLAANYALARATHWRALQSGTLQSLYDKDYVVENIATVKLADDVSLRDILGYSRNIYAENWDLSGTLSPVLLADNASNEYEMYTNETQLFGKALDNRLDWIVGAYYEDKPSVVPFVNRFAALGNPSLTAAMTKSISKALYTQATYELTPKLSLTAGIRETWDLRSAFQGNSLAALTNATSVKASAPNWTTSLAYKLYPDTLLYVASRKGYKSGGVNYQASPPLPTSYGPEKLTDIEVGVKTQWEMGDVQQRLNLDYYHSWYQGVQTRTSAREPTGEYVSVLFDAGRAAVNGVEAEYGAKFASAASLTVNYAYTDFEFQEFFNPFSQSSLLGQEQADSPKHKLTVVGNLYMPVEAAVGTVYSSAKFSYQSRVVFFTPNYIGAEQSGYGTLDLSLNWDNVMRSSADIALFAKNLTDRVFFIGGSGGATPAYSLQIRGEPRLYGLRVRYSF